MSRVFLSNLFVNLGLFAIANKNINEQKQTITTHENKCKELEAELEQEKELLKQSQATIEEQKAAIQKLALMEDERSAVREVADKEKVYHYSW